MRMKCQCSSNRRLVASATRRDNNAGIWIQYFNYRPAKRGFDGSKKHNSPIYLTFIYAHASVRKAHLDILKQLQQNYKGQNKNAVSWWSCLQGHLETRWWIIRGGGGVGGESVGCCLSVCLNDYAAVKRVSRRGCRVCRHSSHHKAEPAQPGRHIICTSRFSMTRWLRCCCCCCCRWGCSTQTVAQSHFGL